MNRGEMTTSPQEAPPRPEPKGKHRTLKIIGIGIAAFIAIVVIASALTSGGGHHKNNSANVTTTQQPQHKTRPQHKPPQAPAGGGNYQSYVGALKLADTPPPPYSQPEADKLGSQFCSAAAAGKQQLLTAMVNDALPRITEQNVNDPKTSQAIGFQDAAVVIGYCPQHLSELKWAGRQMQTF